MCSTIYTNKCGFYHHFIEYFCGNEESGEFQRILLFQGCTERMSLGCPSVAYQATYTKYKYPQQNHLRVIRSGSPLRPRSQSTWEAPGRRQPLKAGLLLLKRYYDSTAFVSQEFIVPCWSQLCRGLMAAEGWCMVSLHEERSLESTSIITIIM